MKKEKRPQDWTLEERLNMIKIVRDHVLPGLLNEDLETFGNGKQQGKNGVDERA